MKRICAWCGKELGQVKGGAGDQYVVTHGMCEECAFHLTAQAGMKLREFLEGLGSPVIAVDTRGLVLAANSGAQELIGVELPAIEGRLCGDVFECEHATLPEGCGGTVHCHLHVMKRCIRCTGRAHPLGIYIHMLRGVPPSPGQVHPPHEGDCVVHHHDFLMMGGAQGVDPIGLEVDPSVFSPGEIEGWK